MRLLIDIGHFYVFELVGCSNNVWAEVLRIIWRWVSTTGNFRAKEELFLRVLVGNSGPWFNIKTYNIYCKPNKLLFKTNTCYYSYIIFVMYNIIMLLNISKDLFRSSNQNLNLCFFFCNKFTHFVFYGNNGI